MREEYVIRCAGLPDAAIIARQRAAMFREMGLVSQEESELLRIAAEPWIAGRLTAGEYGRTRGGRGGGRRNADARIAARSRMLPAGPLVTYRECVHGPRTSEGQWPVASGRWPVIEVEYVIRCAGLVDAAIIARQRAAMFREMGLVSQEESELLRIAAEPWIAGRLTAGEYLGWVVAHAGDVVAGGGMLMRELPPGPGCYRVGRWSHIVNVYTDPEHRKGSGRWLVAGGQ